MENGGRRFCKAGVVLLVVVDDGGKAMDGVSRLKRTMRVPRLCSEHMTRIAVEHWETSCSMAVLDRSVQSVDHHLRPSCQSADFLTLSFEDHLQTRGRHYSCMHAQMCGEGSSIFVC